MPDHSPAPIAINIIYDQIRGQIQHEDNLITQRLNWFLTSQSFLFTAYAIVFNGSPISTARNLAVRSLLLAAIPMVAVAASMLIFVAIVAGALVLLSLRRLYADHQIRARNSLLPPIQGQVYTRMMGLAAPLCLPLIFSGVWIALVIRASS